MYKSKITKFLNQHVCNFEMINKLEKKYLILTPKRACTFGRQLFFKIIRSPNKATFTNKNTKYAMR